MRHSSFTRLFYYFNQQKFNNNIKETVGFKSTKFPSPWFDLLSFEKDLPDIVTSLKFQYVKDSFERESNVDIRTIRTLQNAFVFAGKTNIVCKVSKDHYQKHLHYNATKTYQNAPPKLD